MTQIDVESIADGLHRTRGADVDIAFRVRGAGPAVLLMHGTSANHAVWEPVAEQLAARATVISLDQRGHGRSDKPARGYTGHDFAGDAVTVLDALGVSRAVIAGHSLGGRNAWLVGQRFPDRTAGVCVVDYTPYTESSILDELDVRVAGGYRGFADVDEIRSYIAGRYPKILPGAVDRRAQWGYHQVDDGTWWPRADPEALSQLIVGFHTPHDDEFRAVRAPMTHLRGEHSAIVTPEAWRRAQHDRPADRWVEVADADHYIPEEYPGIVATEIERLLDL